MTEKIVDIEETKLKEAPQMEEELLEEDSHESKLAFEVEKLTKEVEDAKNKYVYLAAEMENTTRRFNKEKENLIKYGNEKLLKSLLDVVDNFERTVDAISSDEDEKVKNIVVGIDMVKKQFLENLKKFGLEEIEAVGKIFDPNFHEALAQETNEKAKEDEILKEYQKGYVLNGRLLRASKVVVNKK